MMRFGGCHTTFFFSQCSKNFLPVNSAPNWETISILSDPFTFISATWILLDVSWRRLHIFILRCREWKHTISSNYFWIWNGDCDVRPVFPPRAHRYTLTGEASPQCLSGIGWQNVRVVIRMSSATYPQLLLTNPCCATLRNPNG